MSEPTKILLDESELPRRWYNLVPDLAPPPPVLHPATHEPVGPEDLAPLFPMALIGQEVTQESYVDIPEEVLDVYRLWRPTPLYRAHRLERALGTPARIYYKYEGVSPPVRTSPTQRSRRPSTTRRTASGDLPPRPVPGSGAAALAFACALFGVECEVWQAGASYDGKPYRKSMMETYGATVHPSPSELTESGRKILADGPDSRQPRHRDQRGRRSRRNPRRHSLRARERAQPRPSPPDCDRPGDPRPVGKGRRDTGRHLRLHGRRLELRWAGLPVPSREAGRPDGSAHRRRRAVGVPVADQGRYAYDFGDTAGMTPLIKMHTSGTTSSPRPSTPADSATTACHR